jgi:hypothetical protein
MKRLSLTLAAFVTVTVLAISALPLQRRDNSVSVQQNGLELDLLLPKRTYKSGEQLKLQVMLRNASDKDLYIYGTLGWGYSSSLMFYVRDSAGKDIEPALIPDSPPQAPPSDKSYYVKLEPDNFLGTSYFAPLKLMNLSKPGKYSIFVEYWCPFSSEDVSVRPFWGKERGKIKSNVVTIEVVR